MEQCKQTGVRIKRQVGVAGRKKQKAKSRRKQEEVTGIKKQGEIARSKEKDQGREEGTRARVKIGGNKKEEGSNVKR